MKTTLEDVRNSPAADLVRTAGTLKRELRAEEGEVSNLRLFLRCIGHAALDTEVPEDATELPPVDVFALAKKTGGAIVDGQKRKAMLKRFKEELLPDLGMILAAAALIPYAKKNMGMSDNESVKYAFTTYAGDKMDPADRQEIMAKK